MDEGGSADITAAVVIAAAERVLGGDAPAGLSGVPLLVRNLRDPNRDIRADAAAMLGRLGPYAKAAVPHLIEALDDRSGRPSVRWCSAIALRRIGPPAAAALSRLRAIARDGGTKANVRRQADEAIDLIDRDSSAVLGALTERVGGTDVIAALGAARALAEMRQDAATAVPALERALGKHAHRALRLEFVRTLGSIGKAAERSLPLLTGLLEMKEAHDPRSPWPLEATSREAARRIHRAARR